MLVGWLILGQYSGVVVQKFIKDLGGVWVRGSASFLPAAQRGETDVEIMLLQDRDGRALGQPVPLAPGLEFVYRRVNFASSHVGGKRSASSELLILRQLFKAFAFILGVLCGLIHWFFHATCRMKRQFCYNAAFLWRSIRFGGLKP